jgi:hypothetical protein
MPQIFHYLNRYIWGLSRDIAECVALILSRVSELYNISYNYKQYAVLMDRNTIKNYRKNFTLLNGG